MSSLEKSLLELIGRTARELSGDVVSALERAVKAEAPDSHPLMALSLVQENLALAQELDLPLCQDGATVTFHVRARPGFDLLAFEKAVHKAVEKATRSGYLAESLIDPVSGKVVRGNVGKGHPTIRYETADVKGPEIRLFLDGHGGVSPGAQLTIPDDSITASRDLHGVHRAVLEALTRMQGSGYGPGVVGVGLGGSRESGLDLAFQQLLRPLNDRNGSKTLAQLERDLLRDANSLGIGPMGVGGQTTLLAVKVGVEASHSKEFLVSICYCGWACRRQGVELDGAGGIEKWLYETASVPAPVSESPPPKKAEKGTTKKAAKSESKTKSSKKTAKGSTRGKKSEGKKSR